MFKGLIEWLSIRTRLLLAYACPVDPQADKLIDGMISNSISYQEQVKPNKMAMGVSGKYGAMPQRKSRKKRKKKSKK